MTSPLLPEQWLAPFRASRFSLRFELGGDVFGNDRPVPRFSQAFDRAREIARDVFASSEQLLGIVAAPFGSENDFYAPAPDAFAALNAAGFEARAIGEWQAPLWPEQSADEDRVACHWRSYDLSDDPAGQDVLLWCAVAYEMLISPKAPVMPFLADFDRNIVLHVYDDRGMDVTALDREVLLPLYASRQDWLLNYDRRRIDETFGKPALSL